MKEFERPEITVIRFGTENIMDGSGTGSFDDEWTNPNELPKV